MNKEEFLNYVLPNEGVRHVTFLKLHNGVRTSALEYKSEDVSKIVSAIDKYKDNGWNVYYRTGTGVSTVLNDAVLTAKKEFYIDVDSGNGKGKKYKTKQEVKTALVEFLSTSGLPMPLVVYTGNGYHVHWVLTNSIPPDVWRPVAEQLKKLCIKLGLYADLPVIADAARILRVPDTTNYKNDINEAVKTITIGSGVVEFEDFKSKVSAALGDYETTNDGFLGAKPAYVGTKDDQDKTTEVLASDRTASFEVVIKKCKVVNEIVRDRASLSEPQWRFGLSIAKYCVDHEWAVTEVSVDHPGYSEQGVQKKLRGITGPHSCTEAATLFPGTCEGCPHKVKSPITLGNTPQETPVGTAIQVPAQSPFVVPKIPYPFFRGKSGGIYRYTGEESEDGEKTTELVYQHDIFVTKRMHDPQLGDVAMFRLHLPKDGVREFVVTQSDIMSRDKCRDALSREGLTMYTPKQVFSIQDYIARSISEMQCNEAAEKMHARFGWSEDQTFILGSSEYTYTGVKNCPPPVSLRGISQYFVPKGSLDEWREIVNFYNRPGCEAHAFALMCAFGAPLIHMSGVNGGYVSLYSLRGGTGKTTALEAMNSVFGHPRKLLMGMEDTQNAIMHRIGVMSSIAVGVDEVTNAAPERLSALLYQATFGRSKARMESKANAERKNDSEFSTLVVSSSNASIADKLRSIKQLPEGELRRMLEFQVPDITGVSGREADAVFSKLTVNYGVAGPVYLAHLAAHYHKCVAIYREVATTIDVRLKFEPRDSFHKAIICSAIAGGRIAIELGLIKINMGPVIRWVQAQFERSRISNVNTEGINPITIINDYISENISNMVIANGKDDKGTIMPMAIKEPKFKLTMRYEPDTDKLYILRSSFGPWAVGKQINVEELMSECERMGARMTEVRKALGQGTVYDVGAARTYMVSRAKQVLGASFSGVSNGSADEERSA